MSVPARVIVPDVTGSSPDSRLNSEVLPAPLGPMTAMNSPGATSRVTSETITAPPMAQVRPATCSTGAPVWRAAGAEAAEVLDTAAGSRIRRSGGGDRRGGGLGVEGLDQHRDVLAALLLQAGLEHRLQQRVVLG